MHVRSGPVKKLIISSHVIRHQGSRIGLRMCTSNQNYSNNWTDARQTAGSLYIYPRLCISLLWKQVVFYGEILFCKAIFLGFSAVVFFPFVHVDWYTCTHELRAKAEAQRRAHP